jgi:hypothetical protein
MAVYLEAFYYDKFREYQDSDDTLDLRSSLFVSSGTKRSRVIEFSHAAVREYLTLSRIPLGTLQIFSLDLDQIETHLAVVHVIYIRAYDLETERKAYVERQDHSLIEYATSCWSEHFRRTRNNPILMQLALDLFIGSGSHFIDWAWTGSYLPFSYFLHIEIPAGDPSNRTIRVNTLLYYSILTGNLNFTAAMLREGAETDGDGGAYGSMMTAAGMKGDLKTHEYLLDQGASVNAQGGFVGGAL